MKATRRNGGKAPTEPYPPYPAVTATPPPAVRKPSTRKPKAPTVAKPPAQPAVSPEAAGQGAAAGSAETPVAAPVTQLHVVVTEDSTVPVEIKVHPLVAAYKADLAKINQEHTRDGLQVIELAQKLVSSATSPAASAGISKELSKLMSELEQNTPAAIAERDPSLFIRERTLAKLRALDEKRQETA